MSSRLSAWGVPVMSSLLHFGQAMRAMEFADRRLRALFCA
jgi:hypothetical protein